MAMNNPLRAWMQRRFVARRLLKLGGALNGGSALEVGCGRGIGIEIILRAFHAGHVDAFDLDQHMVDLAKRRSARYDGSVSIWTGDACSIPQPDAFYDAVFDFGIVHHIPDWRRAITEIHRVLKPRGRFYAEEIFGRLINGFPWRHLAKHPAEDRFDAAGFAKALVCTGFDVKESMSLAGCFGWFIADKKKQPQQTHAEATSETAPSAASEGTDTYLHALEVQGGEHDEQRTGGT